MVGRLLCWLGVHRWMLDEVKVGDRRDTWQRCRRPGCCRYSEWTFAGSDENDERWRM